MPLPDPYENEPAVQVDADLAARLRQAEAAALAWSKEAEALKKKIIDQMGDAHAGMIGDLKVFTNRPTKRWATARLISERGDLAQHFMRKVEREEFDLDWFRSQHADILDLYQVRSFRLVDVE